MQVTPDEDKSELPSASYTLRKQWKVLGSSLGAVMESPFSYCLTPIDDNVVPRMAVLFLNDGIVLLLVDIVAL